ncbi:futalosine hydrolase [Candidatus Methanoperedens nitratireducens]|uniref:adenosylhomocysteine nucleosidase n=1 Tax=Candidatus Methanoperedens nitratireducens TaxID=1392998 RepID=A0A284VMU9_9EURY|nr:futalosine hydrolase [Candidatus Methanoperedens nitroreducens]SNQ60517.1 Futalosine nucleosidase [Candidatus Methanoperedens nitroreducens]
MNFALIAPTPAESEGLRGRLSPQPKQEMKVISEGELYGKPVLFTHCGVGKVNAAHSATLMLENYNVDILILFGIGGGYSGEVGDIVVAESESYGDEGVLTKDGWKSMKFMGFPLLKDEREYYNTFPMDTELVQRAIKALKDAGLNVSSGNFVTVSQCSGTRESGEIMKKRFNGICENMEGAAVAHICTMYRVPMIEVRGISNIIKDRDMKKWDIKKAASNCNEAVIELIKRLK